jgi:hypothetical protein
LKMRSTCTRRHGASLLVNRKNSSYSEEVQVG